MNKLIKISENLELDKIIDEEDSDQDFLNDLKQVKQAKRTQRTSSRIFKYLQKYSFAIYILIVLIILQRLYCYYFYRYYPYYSGDYNDYENKPFVSTTSDHIIDNYLLVIHDGPVYWQKYSYVSYATNYNYLCSSLMMLYRLRKEYKTKADLLLFYNVDNDHAMLTRNDYSKFSQEFEELASKLQVKLVPIKIDKTDSRVEDATFKSSFNKLEIFRSDKYPILKNYSKLIYIDSDVFVNDKLDELFFVDDDFDISMPLAYWLISRSKNDANILIDCPETFPKFVGSYNKKLNYFRIQDNKSKNLKWSTALMVIKPSDKLSMILSEELNRRLSSDYDMDIINNAFFNSNGALKVLTLPHKDFFLITGDFFLTLDNRYNYLADPIDLQFINDYSIKKCNHQNHQPYWCYQKYDYISLANKAKIVHFSDYPLAKPWIQSSIQIQCGTKTGNSRNTLYVEKCKNYNAWAYYHNMFIRDRMHICNLFQLSEDHW